MVTAMGVNGTAADTCAFYASGLGALQLARVGILVTETTPGIPTVGEISHAQVRAYLVDSALALVTRA